MLTIKLFTKNKSKYSIHEFELLKELFNDAYMYILKEVCVDEHSTLYCVNCEYKNICTDFFNAVQYLNKTQKSN